MIRITRDEDEGPELIVCSGPPDCDLTGDDAVEAMKAGCPMCKRIVMNADGSETEYFKKPN